MVEFGKRLSKSKRPEWADYYLNYDCLKDLLRRANEEWTKQRGGHHHHHHHHHHRRSSSFSIIFGHHGNGSNNVTTTTNTTTTTTNTTRTNTNTTNKDLEFGGGTNSNFQKDQFLLLEFRRTLDFEIEKVVLFSLEEQGRISNQLHTLAQQREACLEYVANAWQEYHTHQEGLLLQSSSPIPTSSSSSPTSPSSSPSHPKFSMVRDTHQAYQQVTYQLLEYVQFVELNITAVRKILKKHDKKHSPALSQQYLSRLTTTVDSHLDQLYQFGGLTALIATLRRAFAELHQVECFLIVLTDPDRYLPSLLLGPTTTTPPSSTSPSSPPTTTTTTKTTTTTTTTKTKPTSIHSRSRSVPLLSPMLAMPAMTTVSRSTSNASLNTDITKNALSMVTATMSQQWDSDPSQVWIPLPTTSLQKHSIFARWDNTSILPTRYTSAREPLLDQIHSARSRLQQSTKYVELVAAQSLFFDNVEEDEGDDTYPELTSTNRNAKQRNISSMLNLASTFLYMTNYYIVAPTTGNYAIKLGSTEAMAGIIIGMTPNAALVATILYAWWSNHSYKSALLFAAGCSFAGNVAYAMALNFHSLELVMVGRFLNGFGSARSINRRFIADTFSREDRTAASAAFVTAAALGMAAGPAIATALAQVETSTSVWWTEETAPGWVMMVAWLLYFVAALLYFEEPDRSHIFGKTTTTVSTEDGTLCETQALLDTLPSSPKLPPPQRKAAWFGNIPVMITLWIYFVLKLVLECLLSSCGIVTKFYFDWNSQQSAAFMAFLGLLMFPANMGVARLSQVYEDRELIQGTLLVMLVSVAGIFVYHHDSYSHGRYIVFAICIFLSTNVLEGPNMSLLSKTVPKQWARGIFNSGFLATEAGTAARSVGDVLISAVAFRGVENLVNSTFVPLLLMVLVSIGWTTYHFENLVEDDDEEGSIHSSSVLPSSAANSTTKEFTSRVSSDTLDSNMSFGK